MTSSRTEWNHATRRLAISLSVVLLSACGTTRVVETEWDPSVLEELNRTCEDRCDATIYAPDRIQASRLSIRNGILGIGTGPGDAFTDTAELRSVEQIRLTRTSHGRGALEGLGLGLAGGIVLGALEGAATWEPCDETGFLACFLHPESRGEAAVWGGLAGGSLGGLVGLIAGAIRGKTDVRVYEYRPHAVDADPLRSDGAGGNDHRVLPPRLH